MAVLKKQLEDMRGIRYDIASLKGSISNLKTPTARQFVSPRQMMTNGKTPTKRSTPNPIGVGPSCISRKKPVRGNDPRKSAARTKARRRILQGKQISEDMMAALQMEDLKQLCSMHNVRYRGMPQARVALRKIPGLIVSDTEDLPNRSATGEEVQGANMEDAQSVESESEEEDDDSSEEAEYFEGPEASKDVQPSAH
ncbi:hypothetical protein CBR_g49373 [Chara braunii]|uniref:Uncharacterized protein n=1 Tax=Chara braunii TaxID=69332 RepID=A0A388M4S3_CHABU|nr:hypothetical protein CBR_g49373 [Chara braunii]|eukprot:GBG89584.1 hypothetical protein CBR_g49373 [Chara braunii]